MLIPILCLLAVPLAHSILPYTYKDNVFCQDEFTACENDPVCKNCEYDISQITKPLTCSQFLADHLNFFTSSIAGCDATVEGPLYDLAKCVAINRAAIEYRLSDCYIITNECDVDYSVAVLGTDTLADGIYTKIDNGSANINAIESWIRKVLPHEPEVSCNQDIEIVKNEKCDAITPNDANTIECGYDYGQCCAATCSGAGCASVGGFPYCIDNQIAQYELILAHDDGDVESLAWRLDLVTFSPNSVPMTLELYKNLLTNDTSIHPSASSGEWQCLAETCTQFSTNIEVGCIAYLDTNSTDASTTTGTDSVENNTVSDVPTFGVEVFTLLEGQEEETFQIEMQEMFVFTVLKKIDAPSTIEINITSVVSDLPTLRRRDLRILQTSNVLMTYSILNFPTQVEANAAAELVVEFSASGVLLAEFRSQAAVFGFDLKNITATNLSSNFSEVQVDSEESNEISIPEVIEEEKQSSSNLALIASIVTISVIFILLLLILLCRKKAIEGRAAFRGNSRGLDSNYPGKSQLFTSNVVLTDPCGYPSPPKSRAPLPPTDSVSSSEYNRQFSSEKDFQQQNINYLNGEIVQGEIKGDCSSQFCHDSLVEDCERGIRKESLKLGSEEESAALQYSFTLSNGSKESELVGIGISQTGVGALGERSETVGDLGRQIAQMNRNNSGGRSKGELEGAFGSNSTSEINQIDEMNTPSPKSKEIVEGKQTPRVRWTETAEKESAEDNYEFERDDADVSAMMQNISNSCNILIRSLKREAGESENARNVAMWASDVKGALEGLVSRQMNQLDFFNEVDQRSISIAEEAMEDLLISTKTRLGRRIEGSKSSSMKERFVLNKATKELILKASDNLASGLPMLKEDICLVRAPIMSPVSGQKSPAMYINNPSTLESN